MEVALKLAHVETFIIISNFTDDESPKVETVAPEKGQSTQPTNESSQSSPPQDVVELCKETFQKTADYLRGELDGMNYYLCFFQIQFYKIIY